MPTSQVHRVSRSTVTAIVVLLGSLAGCNGEDSPDAATPAASAPSTAATVSAHPLDTALLFPLTKSSDEGALLDVTASGSKGQLLPKYASDQLPALSSERNAELLPKLRMVAANIDPCFPSGVDGKVDAQGTSQCRKQLRLIFQPVQDDGSGQLTTLDISVHTFYEMDVDTFRNMVQELLTARGQKSLGDEAIDVHPIVKAEGVGGEYATAVKKIILTYAGASNLVKVTFSGLRGGGIGWQMGAVDFVGMSSQDATIPATSSHREEMINSNQTGDFNATVDPPTKFSQGLEPLLKSDSARAASDDAIRAAYRQALQIDNPDTDLNPSTVDCASCHLATPTRLWAERNLGLRSSDFREAYFSSRWNLENRSQTKDNTQSTRCFGYYGKAVAISQRTINEAAAVADFINTHILSGGAQ